MNVVPRAVGPQLALSALQRVSPRVARVGSVALVLTACLMPLAALLRGDWASGDVLLAHLFELYAVLFWTVVRVVAAPGPLLAKGTVSTNGGPPRAMSRSELVQMSWLVVSVLVVRPTQAVHHPAHLPSDSVPGGRSARAAGWPPRRPRTAPGCCGCRA